MKPKIGIALGSGSARGWAHLGVLTALSDIGIKPDIVAGCSVGAFVGAAYACGRMEEFKEWAENLSFKKMVSFFDIKLGKGGLLMGYRLIDLLGDYINISNIEDLEIAFACVATDLETGKETWFQKGSIADAVRSSFAFPGILSPHNYQDRWFIDGGIVNPVPVSLCRAMGADLVIAVNLNTHISTNFFLKDDENVKPSSSIKESDVIFSHKFARTFRERIDSVTDFFEKGEHSPGLFDVVLDSVKIMQDRITSSRMVGDPPDILLEPKFINFKMMDFHKAKYAIEEGILSVKREEFKIKDLFSL